MQTENGAVELGHRISCAVESTSTPAANNRVTPIPWQLISRSLSELSCATNTAFNGLVYLVPSRKEWPTCKTFIFYFFTITYLSRHLLMMQKSFHRKILKGYVIYLIIGRACEAYLNSVPLRYTGTIAFHTC